ncbi:MAG TPA: hypothetical protein VHN77_12565 [Phycisphaerales bacterium]|nr:hypothetical protein [Phycisphaerales bacterium]
MEAHEKTTRIAAVRYRSTEGVESLIEEIGVHSRLPLDEVQQTGEEFQSDLNDTIPWLSEEIDKLPEPTKSAAQAVLARDLEVLLSTHFQALRRMNP